MIKFQTVKTRIVTEVEPFEWERFVGTIEHWKPWAIYNSQWSTKGPIIVITEYNKKGLIYYFNGQDKEPKQSNIRQLYNFLKSNGLSDCYITSEPTSILEWMNELYMRQESGIFNVNDVPDAVLNVLRKTRMMSNITLTDEAITLLSKEEITI